MKFWIVCPLKTLIFGRSKHLNFLFKILANTFSDLLAILKKTIAGWLRQFFFHTKIPGSLPVPITVSELWEWLFPFPSHNSLREQTLLSKLEISQEILLEFWQKERTGSCTFRLEDLPLNPLTKSKNCTIKEKSQSWDCWYQFSKKQLSYIDKSRCRMGWCRVMRVPYILRYLKVQGSGNYLP